MTEMFIAVTDALQRSAVPTYQVEMKAMPNLSRPWYLPDAPSQTVAQFRTAIAKLGRLGVVKVS